MSEPNKSWLMWMWHYYTLHVTEFDTLEEAVRSSVAIEDAGNGSTQGFESPTGELVPDSEVQKIVAAIRSEQEKELRLVRTTGPRYRVEVKPLKGDDWGAVEWYTVRRKADSHAHRLRKQVGDQRVRVRTFK